MSTLLKVKRIKVLKHKSEKFAAFFLCFWETNNTGKLVYTFLRCEIHLVESLKVNLLIENNIILSENFIINIKKKLYL